MNKYTLIISLLSVKGMGNKKVYDLFKKYNFSYEDIKRSLKEELNEYQYTYFDNGLEKAERIYLDNIKRKIGVVCVFDEEFPKSLVDATKPCLLLYYCGNLSLLKSKCVTVIGTRKPDEPFTNNGVEAVKKLVENNYTIVSGLALGCDTIAHTACLDNNGKTIAILPTSLEKITPPSNKELALRIVKNSGLIITEYPYNTPFNKYAYAERDRLQAYLSDSILVIQSTDDGGTMIATGDAIKENKKVFALAGNNLKLVNNYIDPKTDDFVDNFKAKEKKEPPKEETFEQLSLFEIK